MPTIRFVAFVSLAAAVVTASCFHGAHAPKVEPSRTLQMSGDAPVRASSRPFAVVFAAPKGEQVDPSEVSIVFNRPMRPLELADEESNPPARIVIKGTGEPPKGEWRWMGTSALIFAPTKALPRATEYVATIPAGTKALDGSTLAADYTFEFATPRPVLERIDPNEGERHLVPSSTFQLRFNQPVDTKEIERAVTLSLGSTGKEKKGKTVPFAASWPKPDVHTLVKLTPRAVLPIATHVSIDVAADLRGVEGPIPLGGAGRHVSMSTYGPLTVSGMECSTSTPHRKCAASGYLSLRLSNRVTYASLRAHVRVEGAPAIAWSEERDKEMSAWSGLDVKLAPAKSYAIVVTPGLTDEYGQTLTKEVRLPFDTDDEWPSLSVGVSGEILESKGARDLPIASINVPSYDLVTASLDETQLAQAVLSDRLRSNERFEAAKRVRGAKSEVVQPNQTPNTRMVRTVRLSDLLGRTSGHGAALVAVHDEARPREPFYDTRVLASTDLAITGKMSRFGSVVWVTRLSDASPVANADVVVRNVDRELFATKTDADGLATIPANKYDPVTGSGSIDRSSIIIARSNGDWSWRKVDDRLWESPTDPGGQLTPIGMVFTDRGIYKTGESVRAKLLFRAPLARGTATPSGRAVTVEAFDSEGTKIFTKASALGSFGEGDVEIPIPSSAHLGPMQIRADLASAPDSPAGSAQETVELAAYRPAAFKVGVETDKRAYVRGDTAKFTVHGDYLFGAPMSSGKSRFTVTRGQGWFVPPGAEGLIVDDDAYSWGLADANTRGGEFQTGEGALDAKGSLAASSTLAMPHQHGPEVVTIESEVTDLDRQAIAGRTSVVVHPGDFYVALAPPKEMFVTKGQPVHASVLAIDPEGKKRQNVKVHVELVKRSWQSVLQASGEEGHYESHSVDTTLATCDVTTGDAASGAMTGCDLLASQAGYVLVRASAKDRRGNVVAASASMYVLGPGDVGWAMNDTSGLEIVPDKKSYEIGDTATLLVKSPFATADALVTVERAGIYRQERMTVSGPMPVIKIPITEDMRPNAFVAVHMVRGRTKAAPTHGHDAGAPAFRLGYVELQVSPESRRLKVSVTPAHGELHPGDAVDCDVSVVDRAGKGVRANVTFYAVDEGVLMLTGYKTPDPIAIFGAPRALNVFALESRAALAHVLFDANGVGVDKGDEGGGGGSAMRADFRSTAYFEPSLVTGADGKAHVHFKLPDGLTTYRLMAVAAAEDDRFGFGESRVVTSRPLMARPALPRFLRAGDSIEAGVILTSKGLPASNVEIAIDAKGVDVKGDAKRMIALPANGSVEVRWSIAAPRVGHASFSFHAKAGDAHDDVVVEREVQIPLSPEAVALYGDTEHAVAEKLGDLSAMRDDVGGLDMRLTSTALVGLDDGVEQLIEYPYGCTEQLTSRLVPLVPLKSLAHDYAIKLPADLGKVIDKTVASILQNQRDDGGFGYWADSRESYPWLSAYALWALDLAKKGGAYVPESAMTNATRYVRAAVEEELRSTDVGPATATFLVDVLASIGSPDPGYTNRLYEERAKLPLFAKALLAHAIVTSKMDVSQAAELTRDFEAHLRVTPTGATIVDNVGDGYAVILDSEARTTAMVLRALVAVDPSHPLAARIAKGLLAARDHGRWRSTQETAWALLALDDYRHAQEKNDPNFDANVYLNDDKIFTGAFHGRSVLGQTTSLDASKLFASKASGSTLAFEVAGTGTLFYEARLRYAKKELPTSGLDRGFFVKKLVRSLRPEGVHDAMKTIPASSATSARGGDLVLIDLIVVTADPHEQVVIDDPLPAGLEAIQAGLATSTQSLDVAGSGGEGDAVDSEAATDDAIASSSAYGQAWYHREIHDDRVLTFVDHMPAGMFHYRYLARATTFGTYVVPPTRAECMYEPETFGRTGAVTFDVKGTP